MGLTGSVLRDAPQLFRDEVGATHRGWQRVNQIHASNSNIMFRAMAPRKFYGAIVACFVIWMVVKFGQSFHTSSVDAAITTRTVEMMTEGLESIHNKQQPQDRRGYA